MYLANNHIKYDVPYSFLSLLTNSVPKRYRNEKGAIILPRSDLEQKLNGNLKHMNLGVEARGPALMVSALAYVLYAFSALLEESGVVSLSFAITALVIGSALLMLSAFWHPSRMALIKRLPTGL